MIEDPTVEKDDDGAALLEIGYDHVLALSARQSRLKEPDARPDYWGAHVRDMNCLRKSRKVSDGCSCFACATYMCTVCGGIYDAGLTTHCPGKAMTGATRMAAATMDLDYRVDLGWHEGAFSNRRKPLLTHGDPQISGIPIAGEDPCGDSR